MAKVYLLKQSIGGVGHLSLRLDDKESAYISFWPASGGKDALSCKSTFHTFDQDKKAEEREPGSYYKIPAKHINLKKVREWWFDSLLGNNCARTVYMALKEGGLKMFKEDNAATVGMFIRHPDDDDFTQEEIEDIKYIKEEGGIESLPIAPETAFSWIKEKDEELNKGNERKSKCLIS